MRELRRLAWAAAVAAASAAPGFAQVTGGAVGGGTGGTLGTAATTGISGTTNVGGTSGGVGGTGMGGANNASMGGTGNTGGTTLATLQQAPNLLQPSKANVGSTNQGIASSNFLRNYYGNVYYQGSNPNNVPSGLPGGFGAALYPATSTGGTGRGGFGGAGGLGGAGGRAGIAGAAGVNTTDPGGILVPLPRQIAYAAQVRFAVPLPPPAQLQTNLRGTIDRAPGIAAPAGVQVLVDGPAVILRGTVRDQDEARLVEGMVRLTPGVGPILNELTYPGK